MRFFWPYTSLCRHRIWGCTYSTVSKRSCLGERENMRQAIGRRHIFVLFARTDRSQFARAGATFAFCRRGPTACSVCIKRADEPLQLHVLTYKHFVRADLFETTCFCFLNQ